MFTVVISEERIRVYMSAPKIVISEKRTTTKRKGMDIIFLSLHTIICESIRMNYCLQKSQKKKITSND